MTEHSHHPCLLASASPVALDLAGVWAVSQNSIRNVWMDLLASIDRGWLWGCCTVCFESEVLVTFKKTRTITGSSKAFKSCWTDPWTRWDEKHAPSDQKLRWHCSALEQIDSKQSFSENLILWDRALRLELLIHPQLVLHRSTQITWNLTSIQVSFTLKLPLRGLAVLSKCVSKWRLHLYASFFHVTPASIHHFTICVANFHLQNVCTRGSEFTDTLPSSLLS